MTYNMTLQTITMVEKANEIFRVKNIKEDDSLFIFFSVLLRNAQVFAGCGCYKKEGNKLLPATLSDYDCIQFYIKTTPNKSNKKK